jgi:peroxiredoxin family protein
VSIFDPPDVPMPPLPMLPMGIVLLSGDITRQHFALMTANAALAMGRDVVLFATMDGVAAFTPAGSARHAARDAELAARGVAGFAELLASAIEMQARLIVCDAGLKAMGLSEADLDPALQGEIAGLVTFHEAVGDGAIVVM